MKKPLSVLLALVMVLALMPVGVISVSAATSGTTGDCTWSLNGTALTISGNGKMGDYDWYGYDFAPWRDSITSVIIEDGVTSIGNYAFSFCESLTLVSIPNSVTSIGVMAFEGCNSLNSITVASANTAYCSVDGVLFNKDKTILIQYPIGKTATAYIIPDSVTSIGEWAFEGCTSLTSVTIPDSVTTIGEDAFYDCDSLTSVTIPDSVNYIGDWAFCYCSNLTDVYYSGSELDRVGIEIGEYNDSLLNATWHYNYVIKTPCNYQWVIDQPATCGKAGVKHEVCAHCNTKRNENTPIPATGKHTYSAATCTKAATCTVCGVTGEAAKGHKFSAATCTKAATCACGATYGAPLGHKFSAATCTAASVCSVCNTVGAAAKSHTFSAATCTKAATCSVCGVANGKALGHKYSAATCTKAATCACGATYGASLGHKYSATTTKATLKTDGSVVTKCSVCGAQASKTNIKKVKSVTLSAKSYTYNGKAKKPSVTVKDSAGKKLKKGTDYDVSYSKGCKNVGTYKVTVTLKGNYNGKKVLTFKINPPKTTVKKLTAAKKSLKVSITKKTTQVTGYEVQYSTSKAFKSAKTKTVKSAKTTSLTIKSLKAKKTYYVRVRTYKTVGGKKFYSAWSTAKSKKTK